MDYIGWQIIRHITIRIIRSGLHLVTYLDMGNFCDKITETTLHKVCVRVIIFLDYPILDS